MQINRKKLELAMARACMDAKDIAAVAGIPRSTLNNAIVGRSIRPATLGKIAKALNVDIECLVLKEEAS